jgi:hypothetical protein
MRVGDANTGDGQIITDPVDKLSTKDAARAARPREPGGEEALSPFAKVLEGLGREVDRGESMVHRALGAHGDAHEGQMGNVELLALQAGVYRYSEAVDLSAKLVDRAASGVKTVLQGQ